MLGIHKISIILLISWPMLGISIFWIQKIQSTKYTLRKKLDKNGIFFEWVFVWKSIHHWVAIWVSPIKWWMRICNRYRDGRKKKKVRESERVLINTYKTADNILKFQNHNNWRFFRETFTDSDLNSECTRIRKESKKPVLTE
jgi:hypothetical protein